MQPTRHGPTPVSVDINIVMFLVFLAVAAKHAIDHKIKELKEKIKGEDDRD